MPQTKIDTNSLEKGAFILKTIAHPVRLAIIQLLEKNEELSVSEVTESTGEEQSAISHHLINMKLKGILSSRKDGNKVFYFLKEKDVVKVLSCIQNCDCNYV